MVLPPPLPSFQFEMFMWFASKNITYKQIGFTATWFASHSWYILHVPPYLVVPPILGVPFPLVCSCVLLLACTPPCGVCTCVLLLWSVLLLWCVCSSTAQSKLSSAKAGGAAHSHSHFIKSHFLNLLKEFFALYWRVLRLSKSNHLFSVLKPYVFIAHVSQRIECVFPIRFRHQIGHVT